MKASLFTTPRCAILAVSVALSCSPDNPPFAGDIANAQPTVQEYLPTVLAPGAQIAYVGLGSTNQLGATIWPFDSGGFVACLDPRGAINPTEVTYGHVGVVEAGPAGIVTEDIHAAYMLGTSTGDDALVVACGYVNFPALALPGKPLLSLADTPSTDPSYDMCRGVYGRGATPDRVIQAADNQSSVFLHTVDRVAKTHKAEPLFVGIFPPKSVTTLFVDEVSPGKVEIIAYDGVTLYSIDPASPSSMVTATGLSGYFGTGSIWRGKDGVLRVVTDVALYRWDSSQPAVEKIADSPAPPTGAQWQIAGWPGGAFAQIGPRNVAASYQGDVIVPLLMSVRFASDEAFSLFTPSLTPCCDRDACRLGGESYLLGAYPAGASTAVFYDVWGWEACGACTNQGDSFGLNGTHALVVATEPAACPTSTTK